MKKVKFEKIDTAYLEEYRKNVPVEERMAAMRRMEGFPELDEEQDEEEDGEPAYSEV